MQENTLKTVYQGTHEWYAYTGVMVQRISDGKVMTVDVHYVNVDMIRDCYFVLGVKDFYEHDGWTGQFSLNFLPETVECAVMEALYTFRPHQGDHIVRVFHDDQWWELREYAPQDLEAHMLIVDDEEGGLNLCRRPRSPLLLRM